MSVVVFAEGYEPDKAADGFVSNRPIHRLEIDEKEVEFLVELLIFDWSAEVASDFLTLVESRDILPILLPERDEQAPLRLNHVIATGDAFADRGHAKDWPICWYHRINSPVDMVARLSASASRP